MAEYKVEESLALLRRTPGVLEALLAGLPEVWTLGDEGAGSMSPFEVVAHLIHAERADWMPRVRTILEFGYGRDFEPFDRWEGVRESHTRTLPELLEEFGRLREECLRELVGLELSEADLERRGRHPALGVVTLAELLATWTVHDLTHLHQISRVMARQYGEAVGPWNRHLGVLRCQGHSD